MSLRPQLVPDDVAEKHEAELAKWLHDPLEKRVQSLAVRLAALSMHYEAGNQFRIAKFSEIDARFDALAAKCDRLAADHDALIVEHAELQTAHRALEARNAMTLADTYIGVHRHGATYVRGQTVTHDGSLWLALRDSLDEPGSSSAFQLIVKRGRSARDLR